MESHSGCTVHTLFCLSVDLMLYHYPRRLPNLKTTLIQRFVFEKNCNCYLKGFNCPYQIHNIGPILGHHLRRWPKFKHWINVFLLSNLEPKWWSRSGDRGTLFTLLAMNGESPDMSTIQPTLDPIIGLLPCKPKGSICSL